MPPETPPSSLADPAAPVLSSASTFPPHDPHMGGNMLPLLLLDGADTLLFIDSAPVDGTVHASSTPHQISSEVLLKTGSTYFKRLYQPRYQRRVRKERGLLNELGKNFQYVIDLTPPNVDEEAIVCLKELSCPAEIRTWALRKDQFDLPLACVGGRDECEVVEAPPKPSKAAGYYSTQDDQLWPLLEPGNIEDEALGDIVTQDVAHQDSRQLDLPLEYSAIRHREGIEQVLNVLMGLDVILDTPCKMWTFFALAKIFDVATVPAVSQCIISWLQNTTNACFITLYPEVAYHVAIKIKAPTICRQAFAALIGDKALLHLIHPAELSLTDTRMKKFDKSCGAGLLKHGEVQAIKYASKSFAEDVIDHFLHLTGADMSWISTDGEYRKLGRHMVHFPQDCEVILKFINQLKEYIRNQIYLILDRSRNPWRADAVLYGERSPVYETLDENHVLQRIIGNAFWADLGNRDFTMPLYCHTEPHHKSVADIGKGLLKFRGQEEAKIVGHNRRWLTLQAASLNRMLATTVNAARATGQFNVPLTLNFPGPPPSTAAPAPAAVSSAALPADSLLGPLDLEVGQHSQIPYRLTSGGASASNRSGAIISEDRGFNLGNFLKAVTAYVADYADTLMLPPGRSAGNSELVDVLTNLTDKQFRYLPLWARGNDGESDDGLTVPVME